MGRGRPDPASRPLRRIDTERRRKVNAANVGRARGRRWLLHSGSRTSAGLAGRGGHGLRHDKMRRPPDWATIPELYLLSRDRWKSFSSANSTQPVWLRSLALIWKPFYLGLYRCFEEGAAMRNAWLSFAA